MSKNIVADIQNIYRFLPLQNKNDYTLYTMNDRRKIKESGIVESFLQTIHKDNIQNILDNQNVLDIELSINKTFVTLWIRVTHSTYGTDYLSFNLKIINLTPDIKLFVEDNLTIFLDKKKERMFENYEKEIEKQRKREFRQNLFSC